MNRWSPTVIGESGRKGLRIMAKKGANRGNIKMKSAESPHFYYTSKNRNNTTGRLELKKYDPVVRRHTVYKEAR